MAQATTFITGIARPAPAAGWLAGIRKTLAERAAYHRTLRELDGLTDRELLDLGISRHDISRIAREAVYGA